MGIHTAGLLLDSFTNRRKHPSQLTPFFPFMYKALPLFSCFLLIIQKNSNFVILFWLEEFFRLNSFPFKFIYWSPYPARPKWLSLEMDPQGTSGLDKVIKVMPSWWGSSSYRKGHRWAFSCFLHLVRVQWEEAACESEWQHCVDHSASNIISVS